MNCMNRGYENMNCMNRGYENMNCMRMRLGAI